MEDDDDAQSFSPPSWGSSHGPVEANAGSPSGSVPAMRVAAGPPAQHALTLTVPIHHGKAWGGSPGERGGGREDCWSEGATAALVDAWGERYLELNRGNLRQKHWQEVADIVGARDDYTKPSKSDVQCKNRIDTLKKKFKLEKGRATAFAPSNWAFYKRLDYLLGPNYGSSNKTPPSSSSLPPPTKVKALPANNHHHLKASSSTLPVAVPVAPRSFHHFQKKNRHAQLPNPRSGPISSKTAAVAAAAAAAAASADSSGSFPPKAVNGKKRKPEREEAPAPLPTSAKKAQDGVEGLRELTRAILSFGEVYERVESSKVQQVVEMEKQRMGFIKELELQRMQFFVKTQMELTQLKRNGRTAVAATTNNNNSNSDNTD